ncbi:uncharacterized protein METZ01_LOCUS484469, partial [marine metagenome]
MSQSLDHDLDKKKAVDFRSAQDSVGSNSDGIRYQTRCALLLGLGLLILGGNLVWTFLDKA